MLSFKQSSWNKGADFIFAKGGKVYYTEGKLSTGKNSLGHNLSKGSSQSERLLIDLTGTKDTNYIAAQLEEVFKNNDSLKEVMILKGSRLMSVSGLRISKKNFRYDFKREWEQKNKRIHSTPLNNHTSVDIWFHELNRFRSMLSGILSTPLCPAKNFG